MSGAVWTLWFGLSRCFLMVHARLPGCCDSDQGVTVMQQAVNTLIATEQCSRASVLLLTDGSPGSALLWQDVIAVPAPWGVGMYELPHGLLTNITHGFLSQTVAQARQLREVEWCVTVVVGSDSPAFLAAFAESSFKSHLLQIQTTRLLAFTRLPLHRLHTLHHLHKTFSRTNSLLAIINDKTPEVRVSVYSMFPFTSPDTQPLRVATWTPERGLVRSSPHFFQQKFLKYPNRPHILVTAEELPYQPAVMVDDPTLEGGKRLTFSGPAANVMQIVARYMNLTYTYRRPADNSWGALRGDGSWTGMMGLIIREEVEVSPVLFFMNHNRNKVIDYTSYVYTGGYGILAARGHPKVHPWGFLLPLSPLVWAGVFTALVVVINVMLVLPSFLPQHANQPPRQETNIFNCVRVLLQEDIRKTREWWWWERVALGVWMMMILVLTQSYVSNLMSLLAVRHIDNPYQSLRDVLDDDIKIMIVENTNLHHYFRTATSGVFREVGDLLDTERVTYNTFSGIAHSMRTIVRSGSHVLVDDDINFNYMLPNDFSRTGRCDFYVSRTTYATSHLGFPAQKNSPLIPGLNIIVSALVQSGLYERWMRFSQGNATACNNLPKIITVHTVLSLSSLWGMFAVLGMGFLLSVLVLVVEAVAGGASTRWGRLWQTAKQSLTANHPSP